MKYIIICIVTIWAILLFYSKGINPLWSVVNTYNNVLIQKNEDEWYILIKANETKLMFSKEWITASALSELKDGNIVINAWYFGYGNELTRRPFVPAWLYPSNFQIVSDNFSCGDDKNLCGRIDTETLVIETLEWEKVTKNVLSAWPVLIENWVINSEIQNEYSHRNGWYHRTVLVNTSLSENYFLLSTKKRTLLEITYLIQELFPESTAINLDGWPSTSRAWKWDWFNTDTILPTYFVIN
jgi:hypothetical protein